MIAHPLPSTSRVPTRGRNRALHLLCVPATTHWEGGRCPAPDLRTKRVAHARAATGWPRPHGSAGGSPCSARLRCHPAKCLGQTHSRASEPFLRGPGRRRECLGGGRQTARRADGHVQTCPSDPPAAPAGGAPGVSLTAGGNGAGNRISLFALLLVSCNLSSISQKVTGWRFQYREVCRDAVKDVCKFHGFTLA